jgi:hypothetical protein
MAVRLRNVVVDCNDIEPMAAFWSGAADYEITSRGDPYWVLQDPSRRDFDIVLQKVPEAKTAKNRVHFDLWTLDAEAEAERIVGLGATRLERVKDWIVLADPEGNEFCVCKASPEDL